MLAEAAAEEAAVAAALSVRRVGTIDDLRCLDEDLGTSNPAAAGGAIAGAAARYEHCGGKGRKRDRRLFCERVGGEESE